MSKGLIFFCCACAILLFTIINLSVGPIISGKVGADDVSTWDPDNSFSDITISFNWATANCEYFSDLYDKAKKFISGDDLKYSYERGKNECQQKKGMHDMEYTSFIFNAVIGFICGFLGLLHLFDVKKEYVSKTGMIGLICGAVGFIFSFVYVILNGLVYTNYYDYYRRVYKRDGDGVFAEKKGNDYKCLYYDSPSNSHSFYAKYSDLIQKQYNYDKDLIDSYSNSKVSGCKLDPSVCDGEKIDPDDITSISSNNCEKIYVRTEDLINTITNKDISDRFLTTLLLSLFVCLANIGLGIFGFLLFRTPGDF